MKHCDKKRGQCCWQNIEDPSLCAYKNDMKESDLCPEMLNNWENYIDAVGSALHQYLTKGEENE